MHEEEINEFKERIRQTKAGDLKWSAGTPEAVGVENPETKVYVSDMPIQKGPVVGQLALIILPDGTIHLKTQDPWKDGSAGKINLLELGKANVIVGFTQNQDDEVNNLRKQLADEIVLQITSN